MLIMRLENRFLDSKPEKNGNYHSYIHFDNRLSQECNIASKFQGHVKKNSFTQCYYK